jgi:hypothetical protein
MSDVYQSLAILAHSKWDCKYHVVFVPCCVRVQTAAESDFRAYSQSTGADIACAGETEGMPDRGGGT